MSVLVGPRLERHRRAEVLSVGRQFGAEIVPVAGTNPPHTHDFCEFAVVLSGSAGYHGREGNVEVGRGDVASVRPCDWHQWNAAHDLRVVNIYVDVDVLRAHAPVATEPSLRQFAWPVPATPAPPVVQLQAGEFARVECAAVSLAAIDTGLPDGGGLEALGHLQVVLGVLARHLTPPTAEAAGATCVAAVERLEGDLARDWSVAEIADAVGLSCGHLSRQFKAAFGAAPMQVLAGLRARRAAAALIAHDDPVAHVGQQVGWADPNYFSRRFRAIYHMSPTEYRRRFR